MSVLLYKITTVTAQYNRFINIHESCGIQLKAEKYSSPPYRIQPYSSLSLTLFIFHFVVVAFVLIIRHNSLDRYS